MLKPHATIRERSRFVPVLKIHTLDAEKRLNETVFGPEFGQFAFEALTKDLPKEVLETERRFERRLKRLTYLAIANLVLVLLLLWRSLAN